MTRVAMVTKHHSWVAVTRVAMVTPNLQLTVSILVVMSGAVVAGLVALQW